MSETLIERLERHCAENENALVNVYASDVMEIIAAKDAELAALRATIAEIKSETTLPDGTRLSDAVAAVMRERDELRAENARLRDAMRKIAETLHRTSLVQDRSVGLIKQICTMTASDARAALDAE